MSRHLGDPLLGLMALVADAPTRRLLGAVLERSLGGLLLTDHPAADLVASLAHIARGREPQIRPNLGQARKVQDALADERAGNIHYAGLDAAEFVARRAARDATLESPTLIIPALGAS